MSLWDALFGSEGQMPPKLSTTAAEVDWLYDYIYWWCVFFFILIVAVMGYFMWRYRRRPGHSSQPSPSHHLGIELIWSVIPTILIIPIFYWGFTGFVALQQAPADCYKIEAEAYQWSWKFRYPTGANLGNKETPDAPYFGMHVPPGRNVQVIMSSDNVLHSFYVPNFRVKNDVVPGRYTSVWFNAPFVDPESPEFQNWPPEAPTRLETKNGIYKVNAHRLFCTEFCGTGHSTMDSWVFVHESEEKLQQYLKEANDLWGKETLADVGAELYAKNCASCHLKAGQGIVAPVFARLAENWGKQVTVIEGGAAKQVTVDRAYVLRSIENPGSQLALKDLNDPGNPWGNNMQQGLYPTLAAETYKGTEKPEFVGKSGLDAIVEFIKTVNKQEGK